MKTLNRKLIFDIFKHILFFLLLFYLLFAISDYSAHIQEFFKNRQIPLPAIALYYFFQLIKQLPLLIPLSLLITSMKILISLNRNFEIVAMQSAGVSKRKISSPFFIAATLCTAILYLSTELLYPKADAEIESFQAAYLTSSKKSRNKIQERDLIDGTKLIYQKFDGEKFYDIYWVKSLDEVWYAREMDLQKQAHLVDRFIRNPQQQLEKVESFSNFELPNFQLKIKKVLEEDKLSPSKLWQLRGDEKAQTQLWLKLLFPLIPLIIITALIPSCTAFARGKHHLITFSLALFSFFAFFTIMNACAILGESGTLPPYLAILPFPAALELLFILRWIKH